MKLIKMLLCLGQILGAHRNYHSLSKWKKSLVTLRILVELLLTMILSLSNILISFKRLDKSIIQVLYSVIQLVNALSVMIAACIYSKTFTELVVNLNTLQTKNPDGNAYTNRWLLRYLTVYYIVTMLVIIVAPVLYALSLGINEPFLFIISYIIFMYSESRYYFEICMYTLIISSLTQSMNNINISVRRLTEEVVSKNKPTLKLLEYITKEDVKIYSYVGEWTANYRMILMCTKQLNKTFGTEIFLMLLIVPIYYTLAMSEVTANIILKENNLLASLSYLPGFCTYLTISMMVIIIGQQINNTWSTMKTSLTRLQVQLMKHPDAAEMQAVRDLVRLVGQEPLQVRLLSSLPLGMTLLPAALSATVTYFIVILQFNKVV